MSIGMGLEEKHCLSGQLNPFPAAKIFANNQVVRPDHVGTGLGKPGALLLVGMGRQLVLLRPDHPADLVIGFLPAVRTNQMGDLSLWFLSVEIPLLQESPPQSASAATRAGGGGSFGDEGASPGEDGASGNRIRKVVPCPGVE